MKLRVFQSDKGDCLLLTSDDGRRVLVDGGMRSSYKQHVAPALGRLASSGTALDLVYVSHIDQDHISGVLQLMDDLVEWQVHDFQREHGNRSFPKPERPRPPQVKRLWHNVFSEQVGRNAGAIEDALAQSAALLAGAPELEALAESRRELATSVSEGLQLTRRVSPEQLGIEVNGAFDGKLAMVRDTTQAIPLGSLELTVIGPFPRELTQLRKEWNAWLDTHGEELDAMRARAVDDAELLGNGELDAFRTGLETRARRLEQREQKLGDINKVTTPNLASLMLLAREGDKRVLLTGDGHAKHILDGLAAADVLQVDGSVHVDVLKLQHHGSEHNIDEEFCRRVTADDYVICANGEHENPDLRALRLLIETRLKANERRFKLWFNSSESASAEGGDSEHMAAVEALVKAAADASDGRMRYAFLDRDSFELTV
jgi:Metallo-beta-lactamase superfamily